MHAGVARVHGREQVDHRAVRQDAGHHGCPGHRDVPYQWVTRGVVHVSDRATTDVRSVLIIRTSGILKPQHHHGFDESGSAPAGEHVVQGIGQQ